MVCLPPGNNQNRNQFVFLSFGVDPLNWQSFIESVSWLVARLPGALVDILLILLEINLLCDKSRFDCQTSSDDGVSGRDPRQCIPQSDSLCELDCDKWDETLES